MSHIRRLGFTGVKADANMSGYYVYNWQQANPSELSKLIGTLLKLHLDVQDIDNVLVNWVMGIGV
jgi:hypothetical protein